MKLQLKNKKVAIVQSNYIPWKGYFDLINEVDEFIIYDDVQYTKSDWRNRNKIKTHKGIEWITIPVMKEYLHQKIKDTKIAQTNWNKKHFKKIKINYSKSKYFNDYAVFFENLYLSTNTIWLSEINLKFINTFIKELKIETKITFSSDYDLNGDKNERLISMIKQAGATEYVSGPKASDYIDPELFKQENIKLSWFDFTDYNEYNQLFPPFEHKVSIIDLIFNMGKKSKNYLKTYKI